jgi:hypothetical protein
MEDSRASGVMEGLESKPTKIAWKWHGNNKGFDSIWAESASISRNGSGAR